MTKKLIVDTWSLAPYKVLSESEAASYKNESSFQSLYSNIQNSGISPKVLCIVEGRFGKNKAISVNGRYYGEHFWDKQLAKEQTQFLLEKGLMWQMFGHVDRGIEDKDAEKGLIAGIVTHLEVVKAPTEIHGVQYNEGDLFGRAIIIDMEAGRNTHTLLSVGSELSISSRGLGEYVIGETYQCEDGSQIPIMNPDTYELETFDFTRLPGIADAEVHIVKNASNETKVIDADKTDEFSLEFANTSKSLLNAINESMNSLIFNIKIKENNMAKVDGKKIQQVLEDANAKIASLTAKLEAAEEELKELKEKEVDTTNETVEAGTEPQELDKNPAAAKAEETPSVPANTPVVNTTNLQEFTASNNADIEALAKYKDIAETPEELNAVLVKANETLKKCKEDAEELAKCKAELAKCKEESEEKDKELEEAEQVIESYVKLGSIAELKAIVETNNKLRKEARQQKLIAFTEHYSIKKGITQESVKRIIESSKSIKAARLVLDSLPNVDKNKGLYRKSESMGASTAPLKTFAESFIDKAEKRRNKNFAV